MAYKNRVYWCLVNWIIQFLNPFCHFLLLLNFWWNFLIGLFFLISSSRLTVASGFPNFFFRSSMIELSSCGGPNLSSSSEFLQSLLLYLNYTNFTLSASYKVLSVPRPPNLSFLSLILSSYVRFCAASITIFWGFYYTFCSGSCCDCCGGWEAKTSSLAAGVGTGLVWAGATIFCSYFLG